MLRYQSLAEGLRRQIQAGSLRPGDRLPSIRQLAGQHGVSTATAVQACLQLEREGLATARPRSGYFVSAPHSATPLASTPRRKPGPITNPALHDVLDVMARRDLLPLHQAQPAPSLLPGTALAASMSRCLRRERDRALDYATPQGDPLLRRLIAQRYAQLGMDIPAEEIVITAGAMDAITLALRVVTQPGDVVLIETPTYHGILQAVASLQLHVVELPHLPGGGPDMARLDTLLAAHPVRAAVLVPNFHNPLGMALDDATKRSLLHRLSAHNVTVIEDDIYGELAWDGSRPLPMRHWDDGNHVITCSSFSKTLAPGLRIGWLVGGRWADALVRAKYFSSLGAAALPQMALADFLGRHDQERHLRRLRRSLAENALRLRAAVERDWPTGSRIGNPTGGLALWLQLPPGADGEALFHAALAEGVAVTPGHLFSGRGDYRDHVRVTCGLPWDPRVQAAMERLGALVAHQLHQI